MSTTHAAGSRVYLFVEPGFPLNGPARVVHADVGGFVGVRYDAPGKSYDGVAGLYPPAQLYPADSVPHGA